MERGGWEEGDGRVGGREGGRGREREGGEGGGRKVGRRPVSRDNNCGLVA